MVYLSTGSKVNYLGRIWTVLGISLDFPECYEIIASSGYRLEVMADLLEPVVEQEVTDNSWNIAELAARARHGK